MTVAISSEAAQSGWLKIKILGNTTAVANQIGQVANPEGVLLQITDAYLYVKTATAGAALIDIGITATSGADSTNMASAIDVNAAGSGTVWKIVSQNRASEAALTTTYGNLWAATSYLSIYNAAAVVSTLLEAYLFVEYVRLA